MAIRLKMTCVEAVLRKCGRNVYTEDKTGTLAEARFVVVGGGSPENKAFFNSTPGGELKFSAANVSVLDQLEPNTEYYVTIEPATAR